VERIGLQETVDALRAELVALMDSAAGQPVQFPVGGVDVEFQVGVTREAEGKLGLKFWVVELGGGGSYSTESIQKVTVHLEAPVDDNGDPVKVSRATRYKP
jgi:hypothetical protein